MVKEMVNGINRKSIQGIARDGSGKALYEALRQGCFGETLAPWDY
jgi:hypothetical protein